jgi:RNA polymerase sigma-70 factor (ECF subfamily)
MTSRVSAPRPRPVPSRHAVPPAVVSPDLPASVAIPRLLDAHGPRLFALGLRLCGNRDDAQDMVQDTFLQAFRRWGTFRGQADAGTWLYTIAARSCKARMRRKGGTDRRMPAVSQLMPWKETTIMEVAAAAEGQEDPAEHREALARVQREIARLPEHLRIVIVLKEIAGLSVDDVASALALAEGTVKTRLHRGRLALRKAMTARAASVSAPAPIYEKQVCLDLLKTKLEAMDRGGEPAGRKVPQAEVCARCRAVFRELDLVQDACTQMASGQLPPQARSRILKMIAERDATQRSAVTRPARGRRPVARSR